MPFGVERVYSERLAVNQTGSKVVSLPIIGTHGLNSCFFMPVSLREITHFATSLYKIGYTNFKILGISL